ncbi:nonsense-mediated mRNA decay factor SMG7-like isoform X1 [Bidens hawaiensis]|uniref:nonsense-mediated mRNA decay factor SMG7-like isoform X1 n=1 Tax=Bidens hawaiensis TaxID=980011 RepID=UPI004048EFF2
MTIPMNNTLSNSSRGRAQLLYNKNAELEINRRKAAQAKVTSDPKAWQQMRENYESILLEDHAFSERNDIEYALWQLHYKRIEELRAHYNSAQASAPQNAKGPSRPGPDRITKIRSQFKTFLSEATGFYHDLMENIRAKYGLSLGYVSDDSQNDKDGSKSIDVKKGLLSCHRCLIYLGDLARYKGLYVEGDSKARDFAAASSYYMQAATLWPSSGNPHHQLAILASYSGDELLAVYRYFRSLAIETPFITARDNLIIAFEKNRQSYCQLLGDSKPIPTKKLPARMNGKGRNRGETRVSMKDRKTEPRLPLEKDITVPETLKAFSIRFVRLNGILFTRTSLETFEEVFSKTQTDFIRLLSSGPDEVVNFGSDLNECKLFITRVISIMIFTVYNANKETVNQSYTEILQRSVVLQNAFTAVFDLMALIVDRCFQLKDPFGSFLLPGIMVFIQWLAYSEDNVVVIKEADEKQAAARSLFWNNLVLFLNKMLSSSGSHHNEICFPLPEDIELRGFLPLVPGQLILDFSRTNDGNKEKNARVQRIVATAKAIATKVKLGQQGIYFDSKSNKFFYAFKPRAEISEELEDEDEIIVFKPSVPKKQIDETSKGIVSSSTSSLTSYGGFGYGFPSDQFAQPNTSKPTVGMEDINNGFSNLDLFNEQDHDTMIPSKFDSVMTSASGLDSIPSKTKFNKSPVGRPMRHFGPPPGFNTPKPTNENPVLDDYSWLDGYQLPYAGSYINNEFGNSFDCLPQPTKLLNTSKTSLGMDCFPFPGKQVSTTGPANIGVGNGNGWVDYQLPEHSSVYQEPVKMGNNEQFLAVPQQYQGQSMWDGRFFV